VTSLMTLALTFLSTFIFLVIVVAIFMRIGSPVYRLENENIIALLELVIAEQASEQDWDVFMAVPIRHNDTLFQIQQRCHTIASEHYIGGKHLFSDTGRQLLSEMLEEFKNTIKASN